MANLKSNLYPKLVMISYPTSSILIAMILGLAVAFLAGCVGIISPAKSSSTPSPAPLRIAPTSLSAGSVEDSYSGILTATGGVPPYTWRTTGGELPVGLRLNALTGAIAGTPTLAGNYSFTTEVQDAKASDASALLSLSVSAAPTPTVSGLLPNSGPTAGGTTVTISGSNFRSGAAVQFGKIPATSVLVANSDQIQAVVPAEPGGSVSVTVWNSGSQEATATNDFTFIAPPLQITTALFPVGMVEASYSTTLAATGGTPGYTWSITKGTLPAGLQLNALTGTIAGTPTLTGSFSFIAQVQDAKATSSSAVFSLSVSPDPAPTISGISQNSGSTNGGTAVTISGSNFRTGAVVQFGSIRAASIQVVNSTQIQTVTPAEASGAVNVTVKNSDGQVATAANTFTFTTSSNASWNPVVLGVPWASDFTSIAANEINVKTAPGLKVKAIGDGVTDETAAVRGAIQLASSTGGGTVYFPTGDYKIVAPSGAVQGSPLVVPSRVILRGSGSTTSRIFVNDPNATNETDGIWTWGGIDFEGASLSGMTDLGVYAVNSSSSLCALLWNRGSTNVREIFFNNLDVHLENCRSFWFESTNNLLVQGSHFDSIATKDSPIYVSNNSQILFLSNTITYHHGRVHLLNNLTLLMQGNSLIRDAQNTDMQNGTAIESGGVELSRSQNVEVLNNTIETLNAPTDETNDGEAILSQQSTVLDVLDAGSATAITSTTLTDTSALWGPVTVSRLTQYPEVVAILTGSGTGQWRTIKGINTNTKTLTLSQPWNPVPEVGSLYSIFVWTLMNATIQGNTLTDNPNGIVLWNGCYNCTVQNNLLTNSRGIMLRVADVLADQSLYPEGRREHDVAINEKILNNTVVNTSGFRPAFVVLDTEAFSPNNYRGMGMFNIQVGGNILQPYSAAPNQIYDPATTEIHQDGFFPCFLFGPAASKDPVTTIFQNINFWTNTQSLPVTYSQGFLPYTMKACVTPSAPAATAP
jgi:parallel beta-helix repeat protein